MNHRIETAYRDEQRRRKQLESRFNVLRETVEHLLVELDEDESQIERARTLEQALVQITLDGDLCD